MLVEIEAGYAKNEPVTYAVRKAIEAGVVSLIKEGAELELWKFGPTQQEITAQEEEKLRLELEAEEALFIAEEEQIKLKEENKELEKELDELLKEESTDEKDNEDSADPVPNNIHS